MQIDIIKEAIKSASKYSAEKVILFIAFILDVIIFFLPIIWIKPISIKGLENIAVLNDGVLVGLIIAIIALIGTIFLVKEILVHCLKSLPAIIFILRAIYVAVSLLILLIVLNRAKIILSSLQSTPSYLECILHFCLFIFCIVYGIRCAYDNIKLRMDTLDSETNYLDSSNKMLHINDAVAYRGKLFQVIEINKRICLVPYFSRSNDKHACYEIDRIIEQGEIITLYKVN